MKLHNASMYVHQLKQKLNEYYKDPVLSEQYAWWTLEAILKKSKSQLLAEKNFTLSKEKEKLIEQWVHALIHEHMPIQYLIGNVPFCDLTIIVKPPILIPRPETEQWCADLIEIVRIHAGQEPLHILDLCSGTGCIGLAFTKALPKTQVVCVDTNIQAIELGRLNAKKNGINSVTFIVSDLFEKLANMQFDLIVSNPPYISADEFQKLEYSVRNWEDTAALVAADNGYTCIEKIITQAPAFIRSNTVLQKASIAQLVLEHGEGQSSFLVDLMHNTGYTHVQTHKDFSGKDRVVSGRSSHVVTHKKRE